jgi:hypothetical protein
MGDVSAQFFAASPEERADGGERTDAPRDPRGGCGSDGHPQIPLRHTRLAIRPPSRAKAAIRAAFALFDRTRIATGNGSAGSERVHQIRHRLWGHARHLSVRHHLLSLLGGRGEELSRDVAHGGEPRPFGVH